MVPSIDPASTAASEWRLRRAASGLTQRELAKASGIPQPNIAAYERGRRAASAATAARLERALRTPTLSFVRAHREAILQTARQRHLDNVRVFGSVARGESDSMSDVDLLVHATDDASLFDLAGFMAEIQALLKVRVDVVADDNRGAAMARILHEAVPL